MTILNLGNRRFKIFHDVQILILKYTENIYINGINDKDVILKSDDGLLNIQIDGSHYTNVDKKDIARCYQNLAFGSDLNYHDDNSQIENILQFIHTKYRRWRNNFRCDDGSGNFFSLLH